MSHLREYLPDLNRARAAREESLQAAKHDSLSRLMKDLAVDRAQDPAAALNDRWDPEDGEEEDTDVNIIDRSKYFSRFLLLVLCIRSHHSQVKNRGLANTLT